MPMVSRTQLAQSAIYNNALPVQHGGSFASSAQAAGQRIGMANTFAKKHKLVTKASDVITALGGDAYLNSKSAGLYSKGVAQAKSMGYGKKKKRKSTKKKK